jgi:hypothetical protein
MELHWIKEIQDSTVWRGFAATVMTLRVISHFLHCLLLNKYLTKLGYKRYILLAKHYKNICR